MRKLQFGSASGRSTDEIEACSNTTYSSHRITALGTPSPTTAGRSCMKMLLSRKMLDPHFPKSARAELSLPAVIRLRTTTSILRAGAQNSNTKQLRKKLVGISFAPVSTRTLMHLPPSNFQYQIKDYSML